MRRLDALSLEYPFYGSRQMSRHLRREGVTAGRRRVRRLMRLMGLEALYRKPRTSDARPGHRVYPYLLRGLTIDRPDQVWCADITCIPLSAGFLYLVAVMDWASRHVLSWRLSNTLDTDFCIEALEAALRTGAPGIFNTDQGAQFTSAAFTDRDHFSVLLAGQNETPVAVPLRRKRANVNYNSRVEEKRLKLYAAHPEEHLPGQAPRLLTPVPTDRLKKKANRYGR